jgi:phosphoribosylglycinamide formyltransferase 2
LKVSADVVEAIVEAFVKIHFKINFINRNQNNNATFFAHHCHRQERAIIKKVGNPHEFLIKIYLKHKIWLKKVTEALVAWSFGVEFFLADDEFIFSELSPRPHDTGMATLAGTQNFNEFELHLRAILSYHYLKWF